MTKSQKQKRAAYMDALEKYYQGWRAEPTQAEDQASKSRMDECLLAWRAYVRA